MTLDNAIKTLKTEYEKAKRLEWVHKPLAYALYQVWKKANYLEKDRSVEK